METKTLTLKEFENGADMVVVGLMNVIGEEETIVFPALCQKD